MSTSYSTCSDKVFLLDTVVYCYVLSSILSFSILQNLITKRREIRIRGQISATKYPNIDMWNSFAVVEFLKKYCAIGSNWPWVDLSFCPWPLLFKGLIWSLLSVYLLRVSLVKTNEWKEVLLTICVALHRERDWIGGGGGGGKPRQGKR